MVLSAARVQFRARGCGIRGAEVVVGEGMVRARLRVAHFSVLCDNRSVRARRGGWRLAMMMCVYVYVYV